MLRSILVPLDGSKFSETSLPLASALADVAGAKLHIVHVHVPYEPEALLANTPFQFEGVNMEEYDIHRIEQDRAYVAELGRKLGEDGICVEARLVESDRVAPTLSDYADRVDADLILMASHGHSGVSRAWLGSVADDLIRSSSRPLLVTRPGKNGDAARPTVSHILVPLDGSALAETAIGPATSLATLRAHESRSHISSRS